MRQSVMAQLRPLLEAGVRQVMDRGAAGAKLGFFHWEASDAHFEAGRLKSASAQEAISMSVHVLMDGRIGQTQGNRVEALDKMIDDAFVLAQAGKTAHFSAWPAAVAVESIPNHSERTLGLTRERLIEAAAPIVDALKAHNPDLHIRAGGWRQESEGLLVTSGGVVQPSRSTRWSLHGGAQRTEGTDILFAGEGRSWGDLNEYFAPQAIIEKTLFQLRHAERIVPARNGPTTVLLPPEALGMFLYPVWMGINGRNVAKGDSPLRGKLGEQILDSCFTIVDDPHRPFCRPAEMDQDGVPTRKQVLVDQGVLQRFLYDLDSAGLAGVEPTGHNGCGPHAVHVQPGTRPHEDLVKDIQDGLLVYSLIGFGQGNIINGDFSGNIGLGYRIENGEITGRVKDTMIAGNLYELLRREVELSADCEYSGMTPWAVVRGVNASASR